MSAKQTHILLIDDDEDDYVMLRDLFEEMHSPKPLLKWVSTLVDARAEINKKTHDVCLVDFRLGWSTGLDLLREFIDEGCTMPFILLTGHGDHEVDIEAMNAGAADYLVKDQVNANILERSIRYAMHHAETLRMIREREENFRSLLDSTFEGILVHEENGTIVVVNRAAAKIFGYEFKEMIGINLHTLCELSSKPIVEEASFESVGIRKDGTKLHLELVSKPYHYKGRDLRMTAIRDVTAKKQMESQILMQDRLASIGLLASSLAHEIGTPLGVIRGRAEFLGLQVQENSDVKKNVDVIASQIDRVSKLIRSLLSIARGDSIKNLETVSLHQIVSDVLDLMAHEFKKKSIRIENQLSKNEKFAIKAEAQPLQQVLLNLLVNAIHAIESAIKQGRTSGHFISIEAQESKDHCVISIRDSGCGIPAHHMKNIFTPFFTTKDIGVGTGLGLITSYRIVEGWGGTMIVESQENIGTTFKVVLPRSALPF